MTNRRFTYEPNAKSEEVLGGQCTCPRPDKRVAPGRSGAKHLANCPGTPVFCDRRPGSQLCSKLYSHAGECK